MESSSTSVENKKHVTDLVMRDNYKIYQIIGFFSSFKTDIFKKGNNEFLSL